MILLWFSFIKFEDNYKNYKGKILLNLSKKIQREKVIQFI